MMEQELLQFIGIFIGGLVCGVIIMLAFNKLSSGTASPKGLKQEYDDYQVKVETHFEETSKKFQDMTQQYQDLYKHLSVGATTLCRPESVAATLADQTTTTVKIEATNSETANSESISAEQMKAAKAKVDAELSKSEPQGPLKAGAEAKNVDTENVDGKDAVEKGVEPIADKADTAESK
jgi:uncharacterized membrane-anchored protein YhcB (DUF1043 family)